MATTVPQTLIGKIEFFEQHLPVWAVNPTAIGLAAADVAALAALTSQARDDYENARADRNTAKASTTTQNNSVSAMYDVGSTFIKTIRAFAEKTNNPAVYTSAQIPPPAPPAPLGPPEAPTNAVATLNTNGQIEVRWDGSRDGGTSFRVERRTTPVGGAPSAWTLVNVVEERSYIDSGVPQGVATVSYRIMSQRAGGTSVASQPAQVTFGTSSGSSTAAEGGGLSLAA